MGQKKFDFMKEWISLPRELQDKLAKAVADSAEEFSREILVGPCPKCGYLKTMDCEGIERVDDPTCGLSLGANINCGHWEVCDGCQIPKNEDEDCGYGAYDCDIIQNWILSKGYREPGNPKDN
jgi:hypothetical protein